MLIALGAKHVTTVEYNKLTYEHDQITTTTPADMVVPEGGNISFAIIYCIYCIIIYVVSRLNRN